MNVRELFSGAATFIANPDIYQIFFFMLFMIIAGASLFLPWFIGGPSYICKSEGSFRRLNMEDSYAKFDLIDNLLGKKITIQCMTKLREEIYIRDENGTYIPNYEEEYYNFANYTYKNY